MDEDVIEQLRLLAIAIGKEEEFGTLSLESLSYLMTKSMKTSELELFMKGYSYGLATRKSW